MHRTKNRPNRPSNNEIPTPFSGTSHRHNWPMKNPPSAYEWADQYQKKPYNDTIHRPHPCATTPQIPISSQRPPPYHSIAYFSDTSPPHTASHSRYSTPRPSIQNRARCYPKCHKTSCAQPHVQSPLPRLLCYHLNQSPLHWDTPSRRPH